MDFQKLKLRLAETHEVRIVSKLLSLVNRKVEEKEVHELIEKKKVFVLKDKKKIRAVFSYTVIGFLGVFAIMYISRLAVVPDLQGNGIGSLLLARIKKLNIKLGIAAFFLFTAKAKEFYKKNHLDGVWRIFWWRKPSKS
ncbi:MAG: GNAT family N-acetyltransferase [Patescibacteria group bacterium]|nr:GNAT family N-acetyltransferase [Patescibacteria group bacterium]